MDAKMMTCKVERVGGWLVGGDGTLGLFGLVVGVCA